METTTKGMKTFVTIWLGELISLIGSGLTGFALGVWIFERTRQATPFALTMLFANLPRIVLAPLAGSWADRGISVWNLRLNRRGIMILADTGSALTTLAVVFLLAGSQLEVWHIYALVTLSSIFGAFQEPAYMASVTMLVPKQQLARASGMIQMSQSFETLLTPLLAGVLFGLVGLRGIILIDFISYFFAVGALLIVRIPQPQVVEDPTAGAGHKPSIWSDMRFGWRYLRQRRGLFWLLWYFALVNFLLNIVMVLLGPLVLSYGTSATLGLAQTILGAGMLLGSILISAWGGPKQRVPALIGFIAASAVGLGISGLQPSLWFTGGGLFLMLFCVPGASANSQAIFQSKIAPGVQGRVFAIRGVISQSMMPLAFLLAGPLADRLFIPLLLPGGALAQSLWGRLLGVGPGRGIGMMFLLSSGLLLIASAVAYASPRIRRIEAELLDEAGETPADASSADTSPAGESPAESGLGLEAVPLE